MNENDPLDPAVRAFREMAVPARPSDDPLLAKLTAGPSPAADPEPPSRRSLLMRVASWSLAASLLILGGLWLFTGAPGVALGDVIKAAEKHRVVKYKMTETVEAKDGGAIQPNVYTVYADLKSPRLRTELRRPGGMNGAIDMVSIHVYDHPGDRCLFLISETVTEKGRTDTDLAEMLKKLGDRFPRKEATVANSPTPKEKARSILEGFRDLEKHKDVIATKGKRKGKDVLKYRIEEDKKTTVLWVDAATKLPVQFEFETTADLHPTMSSLKTVMSDFDWAPELKGFKDIDALFSTTPPAGYKVEDSRKKGDK